MAQGLVARWARLPFRMVCDLYSVADAQVVQMFRFRLQFVSVHVRLPSAVHRTLAGIGLGCM